MNKQLKIFLMKFYIALLSCFGIGFIPFAPGTFGSLLAIPLLYGMSYHNVNHFWIFLTLLASIPIFSIIVDIVQKNKEEVDPSWIVIDEFLGMLTAWALVDAKSLIEIFWLFILFRFFDIFKIPPATYFDRQVTRGHGTILDDIISSFYAAIAYLLSVQFFFFIFQK